MDRPIGPVPVRGESSRSTRVISAIKSLALFCVAHLSDNNRQFATLPKMRLYNQASSTPIQSSSSLDAKKWSHPKVFLPKPNHVTGILNHQSKPSKSGAVVEPTDFTSATTTPATGYTDKRRVHTNFLFDIDEEVSMKSSSTLSTHTTPRRDSRTTFKLGAAPFLGSGDEAEWKGSEVEKNLSFNKAESPFEVLSTRHAVMTKIRGTGTNRSERSATLETSGDELLVTEPDFIVPEMALTESSSDESGWLDFSSENSSSNPFRSNQGAEFVTHPQVSRSPCSKRTTSSTRMMESKFEKYSEMLIAGLSIETVTKTMAHDNIDPSIISLVVIAANESRH